MQLGRTSLSAGRDGCRWWRRRQRDSQSVRWSRRQSSLPPGPMRRPECPRWRRRPRWVSGPTVVGVRMSLRCRQPRIPVTDRQLPPRPTVRPRLHRVMAELRQLRPRVVRARVDRERVAQVRVGRVRVDRVPCAHRKTVRRRPLRLTVRRRLLRLMVRRRLRRRLRVLRETARLRLHPRLRQMALLLPHHLSLLLVPDPTFSSPAPVFRCGAGVVFGRVQAMWGPARAWDGRGCR